MKPLSRRDPGRHLMAGFPGPTFGDDLRALIREFRVGGLVLFRRNIPQTEEALAALLGEVQAEARASLGRPIIIAVDQEGGPVQRLHPPLSRLPSAREAAEGGEEGVRRAAALAAREMRRAGIHLNLAPVLDCAPVEGHFLGARTLSGDPARVSALGAAWVSALQENGVSACGKHFPGLGRARLDPHHFAPVLPPRTPEEADADLLPFRAAIAAGVATVMTSHASYGDLDPALPATFSPAVCRDLLRGRLGFSEALLSDDLDMAAVAEGFSWNDVARLGLLAGLDGFLVCQRPEGVPALFRALTDAIPGSAALATAHAESLGRLDALFARHFSGA